MKERPISFSAPMVRAILPGTKTQTRRVAKSCQNAKWQAGQCGILDPGPTRWNIGGIAVACPYGKPGDRLWVREAHYRFGHWEPIKDQRTKTGRQKWKFVADTTDVRYNENAPESFRKGMHATDPETPAWHKRLARFMPRQYSRITLEITKIRVERLNDISEADAMAEGVDWKPYAGLASRTAKKLYAELWESLNGLGSWSENHWVWVIEFKRIIP